MCSYNICENLRHGVPAPILDSENALILAMLIGRRRSWRRWNFGRRQWRNAGTWNWRWNLGSWQGWNRLWRDDNRIYRRYHSSLPQYVNTGTPPEFLGVNVVGLPRKVPSRIGGSGSAGINGRRATWSNRRDAARIRWRANASIRKRHATRLNWNRSPRIDRRYSRRIYWRATRRANRPRLTGSCRNGWRHKPLRICRYSTDLIRPRLT